MEQGAIDFPDLIQVRLLLLLLCFPALVAPLLKDPDAAKGGAGSDDTTDSDGRHNMRLAQGCH